MKFRLFLTAALCLCASVVSLQAQDSTNTPPPAPAAPPTWTQVGQTVVGDLQSATNIAVAPYLSYGLDNHKIGGGVLALYNFNNYIGAGIGVDYLGQFSMVSGNVELKLPVRPLSFIGTGFFTNLVATPFVYTGLGTPIGGAGGNNGGISTHIGAGANVDIAELWGGKISIGGAYISRTGAGDYSGKYLNAFLAWRHGF